MELYIAILLAQYQQSEAALMALFDINIHSSTALALVKGVDQFQNLQEQASIFQKFPIANSVLNSAKKICINPYYPETS